MDLFGGRLVEERRFRLEPDGTPDEKTTYAYDELGRREAVLEYAGSMVAASPSGEDHAETSRMAR